MPAGSKPSRARRAGQNPLAAGPFKGVYTSVGPYDDDPTFLYDARNMYLPDPNGLQSVVSRPGFDLLNQGNPIYTSSSAFRGQAIYAHVALDGTTSNWIVMGGHVFRVNNTLTAFEDVTPVGVTIDSAVTTRVFFASLLDDLVVSDGVNRPWLATDLTASPITGTYIDYDGLGTSWSAFGAPRVYGGSLFFILNQVNGIDRRQDISWSEGGDAATGYQQPNFDNNWTLVTASSGALYALWGTNNALYFFRSRSIGSIMGPVGPDLASTATEDSIGFSIGTQASQTMQDFGNAIYFCDAVGRPYRFLPGTAPDPIYLQMQAVVDAATTAYPSVTAIVSTSALEGTLNLYVVAIWSPTPSTQAPAIEFYAFDARTGKYAGRWDIHDRAYVDCLGTFRDSSDRTVLIATGSATTAPATLGYVWSFNSLLGTVQVLTTEDLVTLTTEDDVVLTTEGQDAVWSDGDQMPIISATTNRLGYADDTVWNVRQGQLITLSDAPVAVTINTAAVATSVVGTPTPSASSDNTYRLAFGADVQGRGPTVTVAPTEADAQWSLQSVTLQGTPSMARPEDA